MKDMSMNVNRNRPSFEVGIEELSYPQIFGQISG